MPAHLDPPPGGASDEAPDEPIEAMLAGSLLLDLETAGRDRLKEIGAVFGGRVFRRAGDFRLDQALAELDALAHGARRVLGHNLLVHDLPVLRDLAPRLELLRLPVVDTLVLSPLAFPANPYHRLVKDYKLVRAAKSDPVADARLAASLFADQERAFAELAGQDPRLLAFFSFCLRGDAELEGCARALDEIGAAVHHTTVHRKTIHRKTVHRKTVHRKTVPLDARGARELLGERFGAIVCRGALDRLVAELDDPARRPPWAYVAAWLGVAGGNSVLPPWVRHQRPDTSRLLAALRDAPCSAATCTWCRSVHDPVAQLRRVFGFTGFRPEPRDADGRSLQESVVRAGMVGTPQLAILATGAGKSICYQLPALARYQRRGMLTIVISPLQALMKDQVDHLAAATGDDSAAALYGLLTPPERGAVLERLRLGDTAILYISPEQLRNSSFRRAAMQREIGAWIFDEAHCLSKWGHDFRPDYLYAARAIREIAEEQGTPPPPIGAFTATAKQDVTAEILDVFRRDLGQELKVFESTVAREELRFHVEPAAAREKLPRLAALLETKRGGGGSAVVYFATRKRTEEAARFLREQGFIADAFHAGLRPAAKRDLLDAFVRGEIPVVCATNAFGMGIDKDDVRLVVHADIPGSLESYLQEAGRAGRDRRPSDCVLLFDDGDIETQFKLSALSRLDQRDIAQILRGLRALRRKMARRSGRDRSPERGEIVLTTSELLRDEEVDVDFRSGRPMADTKVKTAVAWLERAGFVERDLNATRVFQGRPRVSNLAEAARRLDAMQLPPRERTRRLAIVEALFNADPEKGLSADEIAELREVRWLPEELERGGETPAQRVLRTLHAMAESGLVDQGLLLSAYLTPRGSKHAGALYAEVCRLERAFVDLLAEQEPDADHHIHEADAPWLELALRPLSQELVDSGHRCHPETLRRLLRSLSEDGRGLAAQKGSLELTFRGRWRYGVRLRRSWSALRELAELRRQLGAVVLGVLLGKVPGNAQGRVRVEFSSLELTEAARRDLALGERLRDPLAAVERGLLFLHEQEVIQLQHGLSVFRQAMIVRLRPEAKGRRYAKGDFEPLEHHYGERVFQIHVMARYAHLGLKAIRGALSLVEDYFELGKRRFVERHFRGEEDLLERATSRESYQSIVDALGDPPQIRLVHAPTDENLLILAGPGSGKTRVVVHRCAYLLRVERVPPRSILMVCFNRNAALEMRRRLRELVGDDARGVAIHTYHGLAMRLTGTSFLGLRQADPTRQIDFNKLIPDAIKLLQDPDLPGLDGDALRDILLAGFRHILVDEYQDIDAEQYALVAAIAGRTDPDRDRRLGILAVGDDDQAIYGFRAANVEFLHRFSADYDAATAFLTDNYRSTAHIIEAANRLIARNQDRMKKDRDIQIDARRRHQPPGGRWAALEPERGGRVRIHEAASVADQAAAVVARLRQIRRLDPDLDWRRTAILGPTHQALRSARSALEDAGIPVAWALPRGVLPALWRIREIAIFLDALDAVRRDIRRADRLEALRLELAEADGPSAAGPSETNPWHHLLAELVEQWREETANADILVGEALDFFYETLNERGRDPAIGDGVRLLTVHAAKGLEFDHVLILGEGWALRSTESVEDARRLFYVGMTRAREMLDLFDLHGAGHPHLQWLEGESIERRAAPREPAHAERIARRYEPLGLEHIYLSWAGHRAAADPVHTRLAALRPGDRLTLAQTDRAIEIRDRSGGAVGMLSKEGRKTWEKRLDQVHEARLLALVERRGEEETKEYSGRLRVERWWVPVIEVVWG